MKDLVLVFASSLQFSFVLTAKKKIENYSSRIKNFADFLFGY